MVMSPVFLWLLMLFSNNTSSNQSPRLEKKEEGFIGRHYETILIILFLILIVLLICLIGTIFILIVLHGQTLTGTEANLYYNGDLA